MLLLHQKMGFAFFCSTMALLACVQLVVYYIMTPLPLPLFSFLFCLCTATVDVYIQLFFLNKKTL